MPFPFPSNPADGAQVLNATPDGVILATYHAATNSWSLARANNNGAQARGAFALADLSDTGLLAGATDGQVAVWSAAQKNWVPVDLPQGGGGSGGGAAVVVTDSLASTSTTAALAANQGRVLKGLIDAIPAAPTWATLSGKPTLATVATSGSYNDLANKPTIPPAATWAALPDKPVIPGAYTLPPATAGVLGGVKIGSGISVAADGTISAAAQAGTGTDLAYDPATRSLTSSTGADVTLPLATDQVAGLMSTVLVGNLGTAITRTDSLQVQIENLFDASPQPWAAQAYTAGDVVSKGGKYWVADRDAVAGDVPGTSNKWRSLTLEAISDQAHNAFQHRLPSWDAATDGQVLTVVTAGTDPTWANPPAAGGPSTPVVDSLTSTSTTSALSANQGKVLKGLIDAVPPPPTWATLSGAPTLAAIATSGSWNDLGDKPTIPSGGLPDFSALPALPA